MLKKRKKNISRGVIDWACAVQRDRTSSPNSNRLIKLLNFRKRHLEVFKTKIFLEIKKIIKPEKAKKILNKPKKKRKKARDP